MPSGESLHYGVGAGLHFGKNWSLSLDYEIYSDVGEDGDVGVEGSDIDSITLGASFRF